LLRFSNADLNKLAQTKLNCKKEINAIFINHHMKPDYLDVILFGILGVVTLISFLHLRPRKAQRFAPAKIRHDNAPAVIRCRQNRRW
jgi:hypothetical protein